MIILRLLLGVLEAGFFPGEWLLFVTTRQTLNIFRLCLPHQHMVCSIRLTEALLRLLPDRLFGISLLRHSGLWPDANEWLGWLYRLEVDLHYGGNNDMPRWHWRVLRSGGFP